MIEVDQLAQPPQYEITVTWFEPGEQQPLTYVLTMQT
jgi:hypothetical protein